MVCVLPSINESPTLVLNIPKNNSESRPHPCTTEGICGVLPPSSFPVLECYCVHFFCARDAAAVSQLVRILLLMPLSLSLSLTHAPYLHDWSLLHWETGRWCHSCVNITMAPPHFSPCPPHTQPGPLSTSTNLITNTNAAFLGLHPAWDNLHLHAPPAVFEQST